MWKVTGYTINGRVSFSTTLCFGFGRNGSFSSSFPLQQALLHNTDAMIIIIAMFTTVNSITGPYQRTNCSIVPTFRSLHLLSIMLIQHHPPANPYVSVTKGIQNRKNGTRTDETICTAPQTMHDIASGHSVKTSGCLSRMLTKVLPR